MAAEDPLGDGKYPDFDISKPNVARVYDAMLGGKDNFAADREFVAEVLRFAPMAPLGAIANRQFLQRVMQYLIVEAGITQFIDLGSGLPTQGNASEVAHQFSPRARVVHVDNDPVVYTHGKALLADARTTDFVLGDVRRPTEILADPVVEALIDFGQPVGLLLFAVLHHCTTAPSGPCGGARTARSAPGSAAGSWSRRGLSRSRTGGRRWRAMSPTLSCGTASPAASPERDDGRSRAKHEPVLTKIFVIT
jgi:hypothetical protein